MYKREGSNAYLLEMVSKNVAAVMRMLSKLPQVGDELSHLSAEQQKLNPFAMQNEIRKKWGAPWNDAIEVSSALMTKSR